jgi:ribosomal protein S2
MNAGARYAPQTEDENMQMHRYNYNVYRKYIYIINYKYTIIVTIVVVAIVITIITIITIITYYYYYYYYYDD